MIGWPGAEPLFWAALLLLAYTYAGYPLVMWLRARARPRPWRSGGALPTVTIVVVAYNEAPRIERRLQNLLTLDYPASRVNVLVASDGSTDGTAARARAVDPRRVTVVAFDQRRGKPAVLDDVVPRARGDVVVLADARQHFERRALRALAAPFTDPSVGAVSGELMLLSLHSTPGADGAGLYWRYEKAIRRAESLVGSTVGATGAIYAIRRRLFEPIPEDTLLDDVLIPVHIARQGYRVVLVSEARAWDRVMPVRHEFGRKVRTIAGNFQLLARERWLLSPLQNPLWFQTVSHKALRLLGPALLAVTFLANLPLAAHPVYGLALAGQVICYTAAAAGWLVQRAGRSPRWLTPPYMFCVLNWATVVAFARFASGRQPVTWQTAVLSDDLATVPALGTAQRKSA
ncbi:MAG: glycosyltransferase family 2 protein [Candidatus Rokubacteria bacterium]|nr:glycosyltransferase family 2 protein [Candidatus Rokubacteria bacterium]